MTEDALDGGNSSCLSYLSDGHLETLSRPDVGSEKEQKSKECKLVLKGHRASGGQSHGFCKSSGAVTAPEEQCRGKGDSSTNSEECVDN